MKKSAKQKQPPAPPAKKGTRKVRFNRHRVGLYLRILFELDFIERQMGTGGLTVRVGWLPDRLIYQLMEEEVFGSGVKAEQASDVFFSAWMNYCEYFGTREAFDPKRMLDWLEAGDFRRNPFRKKPKGLWTLPYELGVL